MFTLQKKREFVESFQNSFGGKKNPLWVKFVAAYFESAPVQTLENPSDQRIFNQIKRSWDFFEKRKSDDLKFQYSFDNNTRKLKLEILQPDQPFILETLHNILAHYGLSHGTIYHPVIKTRRDNRGKVLNIFSSEENQPSADYNYESLISVEIDFPEEGKLDEKEFIADLEWRMKLVTLAVEDWPRIRQRIQKLIPKKQHPEWDFFDWLYKDNFLFLGLRYFPIRGKSTLTLPQKQNALGIFQDAKIMRAKTFIRKQHRIKGNHGIFSIEKTNFRSPINRSARIDLIEVLCEETQEICQIIGIFTRRSYNESVFRIPLLKAKANHIFESFSLKRTWHDGKALEKTLESIPHDEYWKFSEKTIKELCSKVLGFHEESLPVFTLQQSEYNHSTTILVFLGRNRYSTDLRYKMGKAFAAQLGGELTSVRGIVDDAPFARLIFAVDNVTAHPKVDTFQDVIETISLSWDEKRRRIQNYSDIHDPFFHYFDTQYQKDFLPEQAVVDTAYFKSLGDGKNFAVDFSVRTIPYDDTFGANLAVRIFSREKPIILSQLLDVLQNYGMVVVQEKTYPIKGGAYYLHVCAGIFEASVLEPLHRFHICQMIEETLNHSYTNDKFNKLFTAASFNSRQVMVMRAMGEYCLQAQYPYSYKFIAETLSQYPAVTKLLMRLFEEKFLQIDQPRKRDILTKSIAQEFLNELDTVDSFDQDQLFRDLKSIIDAMVRTNYYLCKEYISFKLRCADVPRLKDPLPLFEIFVSSPLMQGIHLRSSKVARGGIRYSDRVGDFRTEVLQLMQAQDLKNALIVPTGAKGGFVIKKSNPTTDEVKEAYTTLIRGLLDITDNQKNGEVCKNPQVICFDEDDTYLVVAADKGTATFSDLANSIASEYEFWMGDAFASGGAHGYDHKKMGITAKGAFISIAHHLKKINLDPAVNSITVVGVGDMAGDVFGNGMILYDSLKLLGAFNHTHIFIDPNPDPQKSYEERKRLFNNPKLTWADYSPQALSTGGEVYERASKTIKLSVHAQLLFSLPEIVTPNQLIQCLLSFNADLMYLGGVGTFIRASDEIYTGDKANDIVRVSASDVRARVIGEGANLGVTPLARIELAKNGVLINSDAIDNAGGVNCSDHEVNLKILLTPLNSEERNKTLEENAHEVAQHVLEGNVRQNHALDFMEREAERNHIDYCDLIVALEKQTSLKRSAVFLDKDINLRNQRTSLTRPELAIVLSYTKNLLKKYFREHYDTIEGTSESLLKSYFPSKIGQRYQDLLQSHLLRKELVILMHVNRLVDSMGALQAFKQIFSGRTL